MRNVWVKKDFGCVTTFSFRRAWLLGRHTVASTAESVSTTSSLRDLNVVHVGLAGATFALAFFQSTVSLYIIL